MRKRGKKRRKGKNGTADEKGRQKEEDRSEGEFVNSKAHNMAVKEYTLLSAIVKGRRMEDPYCNTWKKRFVLSKMVKRDRGDAGNGSNGKASEIV